MWGETLKMVGRKNIGAIGVGAMIVFIAIVLIAGVAAYVFIMTSSRLESQSLTTGGQTTGEVSSGIKITDIEAHNRSGLIDELLFTVSPRAGSPEIDLSAAYLELANTSVKCILNYSSFRYSDSTSGSSAIFNSSAFPIVPYQFGIIVIIDADSSCKQYTPVLNRGDVVMIAVNATECFHGIGPRVDIQGSLTPEEGGAGLIQFRTPSGFYDKVFRLIP